MTWPDSPSTRAHASPGARSGRTTRDPTLTAYLFQDNEYVRVPDTTIIEPGTGFWLGSRDTSSSLQLSNFQTPGSDPDGRFRVYLSRAGT